MSKGGMNTKTMRLPPRRDSTSNKRKDRDEFDAVKSKPDALRLGSLAAGESVEPNKLLAGYLAHEFLTKGTLFGEAWVATRSQTAETPVSEEDLKKEKPPVPLKPSKEAQSEEVKRQRYVELSYLFRADGTHLTGIVNPTQLARFIQM